MRWSRPLRPLRAESAPRPAILRVTFRSGSAKFAACMKSLLIASAVSLALGLALARAEEPKKDGPKPETAESKQEPKTVNDNEVAVIKTTEGELVLQFWPDVAPKTVENFKTLAKKGFYDGTCFHRIVKGFMIQGGDPLTKDPAAVDGYGSGDPGYKIKAEFSDRPHVRGVVSMARNGDPLERTGQMPRPQFADSAGSQFFICLDTAPHLNGRYTAFGRLIKGEDVLLKIGDMPTKPNRYGEKSVPEQRLGIVNVKIVAADSVK